MVEKLKKAHDEARKSALNELTGQEFPIHPGVLVREVDAFMDRDDDIVIADGGDAQVWMTVTRTCRSAMNILDSGLYGCLGVGLPYGLAAKLINPGRRFSSIRVMVPRIQLHEIETSIRKKLPIVIVIETIKMGYDLLQYEDEIQDLIRVPSK